MKHTSLFFFLLFHLHQHLGWCVHEKIYIKPSPNSNITCPGTPCYTLMQHVTNGSSGSNITLVLLPGNHELTSQYSADNKVSVTIMAYSVMPSIVECSTSGKLLFRSIEFVRISNITFTGCGGNEAFNVNNFILEDSNFTNGSNNDDGGAWSIIRLTNLMIISSTFANNVVMGSFKSGGALHILFVTNLTISQCTFVSNKVIDPDRRNTTAGGALYISSATNSVIDESTFSNNQVHSDSSRGGALHAFEVNMTITTSIFENNEANGTSFGDSTLACGGALYILVANLTIYNSTFIDNQAKGTFAEGGAVFASGINSTFDESSFTGNQAYGRSDNRHSNGKGGALYIVMETNSTISKSVFSNNQANGSHGSGGALHIISYFLPRGVIVIQESTFTDNFANYSGGAVYIRAEINVPTIVIGCTFTNNRLLLGHGGAIYVIDSVNLTTVNSFFSSNSAAVDSGRGGALYITSTYTYFHGCTFSNNEAANQGGEAVYVDGQLRSSYGVISAYQCHFYQNKGGAIYGVSIREVSIHLSHFISNLNGTGAAVHVSVNSRDVTLIQGLESGILINQSRFTGNTGAIHSTSIKQMHVYSSNFTSNTGNRRTVEFFGDGLADNIVSINECTFENNIGGAMYSHDISSLSVDKSTFISNTANSTDEGVIYSSGSYFNVTISNSLFHQNSATSSCGVVRIIPLEGDVINISLHTYPVGISFISNIFSYNTATYSSGGVGCLRSASVNIEDNNFSHNVANSSGGVFLIENSIVAITGSSFINNTASDGGVSHIFNSSVVLEDSILKQNKAILTGGIVSTEMSNITVSNSMLDSNRAGRDGGIVFTHNSANTIPASVLHILSSNFSESSALNGGILYGQNGAIDVTIKNSHLGLNDLTEKGTFAAVWNLALSIAWENNEGFHSGDIFACNSVIIGHSNIIVNESNDCLSTLCKTYHFVDTHEEDMEDIDRTALVATCTANSVTETDASTTSPTESNNGVTILVLSSVFSLLIVLTALLIVIVILVTMKLKKKSAPDGDVTQQGN